MYWSSGVIGSFMDRIFKRPFLWPELYRRIGRVVNFRLCLMKNPLLYRSARPKSGRRRGQVRYGAARSNSEWAGPAACVGRRFSAVALFGIDRLDEPGHAAGRGMMDPGVIGLSLGSRRVTCGGTGMDRPR